MSRPSGNCFPSNRSTPGILPLTGWLLQRESSISVGSERRGIASFQTRASVERVIPGKRSIPGLSWSGNPPPLGNCFRSGGEDPLQVPLSGGVPIGISVLEDSSGFSWNCFQYNPSVPYGGQSVPEFPCGVPVNQGRWCRWELLPVDPSVTSGP